MRRAVSRVLIELRSRLTDFEAWSLLRISPAPPSIGLLGFRVQLLYRLWCLSSMGLQVTPRILQEDPKISFRQAARSSGSAFWAVERGLEVSSGTV